MQQYAVAPGSKAAIVLQCRIMTHTLTIRLTDELERWLGKLSRETGIPKSEIVREQLEKARTDKTTRRFMRLAGTINGSARLSARKGYSSK